MPRFANAIQLPQQAAPGAAIAGRAIIYTQTDGKVYAKTPAGTYDMTAVQSVAGKTGAVTLTASDVSGAYSAANPPPYPADAVSSVAGKTGAVTLVAADVSGAYSAASPPPYPVTSVAGRTGAVTITSADLGATGTRDATTFLRGDGSWAVPAGGSGGTPTNMVTTDTPQTITANKVFQKTSPGIELVSTYTPPGKGRTTHAVFGIAEVAGDWGYGSQPGDTVIASPDNDGRIYLPGGFASLGDMTTFGSVLANATGGGLQGYGVSVTGEFPNGSPAAPAGGVRLYTRTAAGRRLLSQIGPSGISSAFQPNIFSNKVALWLAQSGASASTLGWQVGNNGTLTARNPLQDQNNAALVNLFTSMRRLGFVSAAAASSVAGVRHTVASFFSSTTAGLGGFFFCVRAGVSQYRAGNRLFVGMSNTAGGLPLTAEPTATFNQFAFYANSTDTNWKVTQAGNATAAPVDLGANFPANTSSVDMYEFRMFSPPGSMVVKWSIERLNTGHFTEGTFATGTVAPASNMLLTPQILHGTGAGATAVAIDIASAYVETDN